MGAILKPMEMLHDLLQREIDVKGRHPAAVRREFRRELKAPIKDEPVPVPLFPVTNVVAKCPRCDVELLAFGRLGVKDGKRTYHGITAHPDTGRREFAVDAGPVPSFDGIPVMSSNYRIETRENCDWNTWATAEYEGPSIEQAIAEAAKEFHGEPPSRNQDQQLTQQETPNETQDQA